MYEVWLSSPLSISTQSDSSVTVRGLVAQFAFPAYIITHALEASLYEVWLPSLPELPIMSAALLA